MATAPALTQARTRAALGALVLLVVIAAIAVAMAAGSSETPPPTGAASVVPADVLAYVHVSTDANRSVVKWALATAGRLPDFPLVSGRVTARLTEIAGGGGRSGSRRSVHAVP